MPDYKSFKVAEGLFLYIEVRPPKARAFKARDAQSNLNSNKATPKPSQVSPEVPSESTSK